MRLVSGKIDIRKNIANAGHADLEGTQEHHLFFVRKLDTQLECHGAASVEFLIKILPAINQG